MNRTRKAAKVAKPVKGGTTGRLQKTIQMLQFATELHRTVTTSLNEIRPVVISAAMLGFSRLTRDEQIALCSSVRQQHTPAAPQRA